MAKRIWMISDSHLGCRSNSVLWLKIIEDYFFNFFIPLVKKEYKKGDVLYHLGDVFDNRQSVNLAAQDLAIRVFEELGKVFPDIHIIVGNHDIMRKNSNEISSVDCLKYIPNVTVLKEPKILEYEDATCLLMPWRRNSDHEKETLDSIKQNIDYMFCHTETQGVQISPSTKHLHDGGNTVSTFKRFKRVYSGHIHYRQEKGNFILVGNPYQMTRSDRGNQKGIYLLDLKSGEHTFYENNVSPQFIRYYINNILEMRMEDIEKEIRDNFVDVFIPSNVLGKYNINKFMDYLDGVARKLEPRIYDEENPYDIEDGELSDFNGELNLMNIAAEYINSLEYDDDLKERLKVSVQELYKRTLSPNYED
tara:strand:- start:2614 stop:3702 length:1089 start_codon:yes stop_codon:yes gene_type:complete